MLTDLHCHMLPGIDDGSRDLDESLAMARIAVQDGIATTVLTPHHLKGDYLNPADGVRHRCRELGVELARAGIALELLPGSELHLVPELPEAIQRGQALTIADRGKAVLVELPTFTIPVGSEILLAQILAQGLTPLIAHPERNLELRRAPERLADWIDMGCLGQATSHSLAGYFGRPIQQATEIMIRAGSIHVVASDAHHDQRRIPQMSIARAPLERVANAAVARLLLETYPADLANGRDPDRSLLAEALAGQAQKRKLSRWWRKPS